MRTELSLYDCVVAEAYNTEGHLVCRLSFSTLQWYEEEHPLIEENVERVKLNVAEMKGWHFDAQGEMESWWQNKYAADGSLLEAWNWYRDGTADQFLLEDGILKRIHHFQTVHNEQISVEESAQIKLDL